MDPYNLRSEELAIAECMHGVEVRRVWSEMEMVCSFGGQMFPGTPDGMFESWDGALTCVQVVRVPVVAGMAPECMLTTIVQTVLTKVVKSQHWLRACHAMPYEFIIFCWLPFTIPDSVADGADDLMQRVRKLDPRFSLRLRVPAQPGALFPALFAYGSEARRSETRGKCVSESDVSALTTGAESDEEEGCLWDITWAWDSECVAEAQEEAEESDGGDWDITWDWQLECSGLPDQGDAPAGQQQEEGTHLGQHHILSDAGLPRDDGG